MIGNIKDIRETDVKGKNVLLRCDLDVPLKEEGDKAVIADDTRLKSWLPTLEYLLSNQANLTIVGHLGRPNGRMENFSLRPVADWLASQLELHNEITPFSKNGFDGWKVEKNVFLLENLRFYKEEEENDKTFAEKLSKGCDLYVNDAFAVSHRNDASVVAITKFLPHFAGIRLQEEIKNLSAVITNPKRPLVVVIGGAKIETKLPMVEKMHKLADYVLVGGEIAEQDQVLMKVAHEKTEGVKSELLIGELLSNRKDITEDTIEKFLQTIYQAQTIVWNGPMGLFEEGFEKGTKDIAEGISKTSAFTVAGGGDTISFLKEHQILHKFAFVSMGGGAMLNFLAGENLPGLEALVD